MCTLEHFLILQDSSRRALHHAVRIKLSVSKQERYHTQSTEPQNCLHKLLGLPSHFLCSLSTK
jgi:hypothetical protein